MTTPGDHLGHHDAYAGHFDGEYLRQLRGGALLLPQEDSEEGKLKGYEIVGRHQFSHPLGHGVYLARHILP